MSMNRKERRKNMQQSDNTSINNTIHFDIQKMLESDDEILNEPISNINGLEIVDKKFKGVSVNWLIKFMLYIVLLLTIPTTINAQYGSDDKIIERSEQVFQKMSYPLFDFEPPTDEEQERVKERINRIIKERDRENQNSIVNRGKGFISNIYKETENFVNKVKTVNNNIHTINNIIQTANTINKIDKQITEGITNFVKDNSNKFLKYLDKFDTSKMSFYIPKLEDNDILSDVEKNYIKSYLDDIEDINAHINKLTRYADNLSFWEFSAKSNCGKEIEDYKQKIKYLDENIKDLWDKYVNSMIVIKKNKIFVNYELITINCKDNNIINTNKAMERLSFVELQLLKIFEPSCAANNNLSKFTVMYNDNVRLKVQGAIEFVEDKYNKDIEIKQLYEGKNKNINNIDINYNLFGDVLRYASEKDLYNKLYTTNEAIQSIFSDTSLAEHLEYDSRETDTSLKNFGNRFSKENIFIDFLKNKKKNTLNVIDKLTNMFTKSFNWDLF